MPTRQLLLDGTCPVSDAVDEMASAGVEERGAVFTRREVVDFLLDLVGYTSDKELGELRILEPSFGHGDFLLPVIERLLASWRQHGGPSRNLTGAIEAVELHHDSISSTRRAAFELLRSYRVTTRVANDLLDAWLTQADFLLHDCDSDFDFVVGNPPYVRIERIPDVLMKEYRLRYKTMYDRADIYVPFIERGLRLLSSSGQLAFICADRWMKNKYGGPLRKLIAEEYRVKCCVDMTDTPAFHSDVIAYPAITVISREVSGPTMITSRPSVDSATLTRLVKPLTRSSKSTKSVKRIDGFVDGDSPWILTNCDQLALVRRLESEFPLLEDAGCKVGIGVATGADKVFIDDYDSLDVESSRKLPLAITRDIASGTLSWTGKGVVNPFNDDGSLVDLDDFPKLRQYFAKHEDQLKKRHVAKKNTNKWYRTIDRIHADLATQPKLLIPDIKGHANIVVEDGTLYPTPQFVLRYFKFVGYSRVECCVEFGNRTAIRIPIFTKDARRLFSISSSTFAAN